MLGDRRAKFRMSSAQGRPKPGVSWPSV